MKVLISGDRGFISGYLIPVLLKHGIEVFGFDNDWKYGKMEKSFDTDPNYHHFAGIDAKVSEEIYTLLYDHDIDIFIMSAAIIGGISLFHSIPYTLLAENERIMAGSFDAAIKAYAHMVMSDKPWNLQRVIVVSSSMVFESTNRWPSREGEQFAIPPPFSSYGFQKLACEYFAGAAKDEFELPYVIVRPFNAVGVGEYKAKIDREVMSGNISLAMSHVIPDLVKKILMGQYPLRIFGDGSQIRHYTYAGDIAEGIYKTLETTHVNEDFNLSTAEGHTVLELAKMIWDKICPEKEFKYEMDPPFKCDVQKRIPDVRKAKRFLNFEATTPLDTALDEVIAWVREMLKIGKI